MTADEMFEDFLSDVFSGEYEVSEKEKCSLCGEQLDLNDEWQNKYGACSSSCYGRSVGAEGY